MNPEANNETCPPKGGQVSLLAINRATGRFRWESARRRSDSLVGGNSPHEAGLRCHPLEKFRAIHNKEGRRRARHLFVWLSRVGFRGISLALLRWWKKHASQPGSWRNWWRYLGMSRCNANRFARITSWMI